MQVISANPEFRYIAQPFVAYDLNGRWGHDIVKYDYARFLDPADIDLVHIGDFIEGILGGRNVLRAPWQAWRADFWHSKSRTVMKILQAKALMPWFEERFALKIIYLLRHPLAQTASVIKSGWPPMHLAFIEHPTFLKKHLSIEQRKLCHRVASQGSLLDQHVLTWCLDNLLPIRALKTAKSWTVITYEDCVLQPEATLRFLANALNLSSIGPMQKQMSVVSGTAKFSNASVAQVLGDAQLAKWQRDISPSQLASAFDILKALDIDAYSADSLVASDNLRISNV
jgi:hypothetical protein